MVSSGSFSQHLSAAIERPDHDRRRAVGSMVFVVACIYSVITWSATAELFRNLNCKHGLAAQKARMAWARDGDVNTKLFHKAVNQRRMK